MKSITLVEPKEVVSVYSGRPGCACGCRGNYRYNPEHMVLGGELRGYEVSAEEVNFVQVKKVLNLLKANTAEVETTETEEQNIYFLETTGRMYIVWSIKSQGRAQ